MQPRDTSRHRSTVLSALFSQSELLTTGGGGIENYIVTMIFVVVERKQG